MSPFAATSSLLSRTFGPEWAALEFPARHAVAEDFALLCRDEYDVTDPTMADSVERENMDDAAREYRRRIGRNNLASYARCLLVSVRDGAQ